MMKPYSEAEQEKGDDRSSGAEGAAAPAAVRDQPARPPPTTHQSAVYKERLPAGDAERDASSRNCYVGGGPMTAPTLNKRMGMLTVKDFFIDTIDIDCLVL
ncbi:hypothetical protein EVAR_37522_1 [Eumeta japonica]|uniref:Uncharacterized protein n=1 Tax=Eumeta variegata TaxID=151549 RepID=A0A4C1X9P0_EUMVA|nr:hypothetical protein EVAR_37522_1 [Eumeta japonica]